MIVFMISFKISIYETFQDSIDIYLRVKERSFYKKLNKKIEKLENIGTMMKYLRKNMIVSKMKLIEKEQILMQLALMNLLY